MHLIVTGSRNLNNYTEFQMAMRLSEYWKEDIKCIYTGDASGADKFAQQYAELFSIPHKKFVADWDTNGRAAGPIRNGEMVNYVKGLGENCALLALWDGSSRGTYDCLSKAFKVEIPIYVHMIGK